VIVLFNVGRILMVVWIIYGLLLVFAPGVLHQPPDQFGGIYQVAIAFGLGYLMDRGISAVHRKRAARENTGIPAEPTIGEGRMDCPPDGDPDTTPGRSVGDDPLPVTGGPHSGFPDGQHGMIMESTKRCPFCAENILLAAIKCKHCQSDILLPASKQPAAALTKQKVPTFTDRWYFKVAILLAAITLFFFRHHSDDPGGPGIPATDAALAETPPPDSPAILNDAKALDAKYGIEATVFCGSHADDYLRSASQYAFKWDDMAFVEAKFDNYLKVVASPGVLTSVSNKVSLQNGFGAYTRIELFCEYDTQSKKTIAYSIDSPPTPSPASPISVPHLDTLPSEPPTEAPTSSSSDQSNTVPEQVDAPSANAQDAPVPVGQGVSPLVFSPPSFDCTKAKSPAEHLICKDEELATLDRENAAIYIRARAVAPDEMEFIRRSREEWLKREHECTEKPCLVDWYATRKRELSTLIDAASGEPTT
jgi:hypothetical protein